VKAFSGHRPLICEAELLRQTLIYIKGPRN